MRMHLWSVKKGLPAMTPASIVIEVATAVTASARVYVNVPVSVPAMTSEDTIREIPIAIRSTTIQTSVTRVMTVNKLSALLIQV